MTHVVVTIDFEHYNTKINPLYCNDIEEAEEEYEEEEEKVCRICLETNGHLINVCGCKGSVKYVHKECIEKWQKMAPTLESKTYCQLCKEKYEFEGMYKQNKRIDIMFLCFAILFVCFIVILITMYFT